MQQASLMMSLCTVWMGTLQCLPSTFNEKYNFQWAFWVTVVSSINSYCSRKNTHSIILYFLKPHFYNISPNASITGLKSLNSILNIHKKSDKRVTPHGMINPFQCQLFLWSKDGLMLDVWAAHHSQPIYPTSTHLETLVSP